MPLTTDPNDPRLGHGADDKPVSQNDAYLVLSEEERAKGFVRPVRRSYRHVGPETKYPLRDLDEQEKERYAAFGYVKYEKYPDSELPVTGKMWTLAELARRGGCNTVTTMAQGLAETWARDIHFYGATYCSSCQQHRPVSEFVWEGTEERLGS